jgi:hypothetical protein
MRQIHPVSFHETFVASGVYNDFYEGVPAGRVEKWTIHELPDGAQLIRVDLDWSEWSLLVEGWRSAPENGKRIEHLEIHFLGTKRGGVKHGKASYLIDGDSVHLSCNVDGEPQQDKEILLPSNCIVSAAPTLFFGLTMVEIAQANGNCVPVCLCDVSYLGYPKITFGADVHDFSAVKRESRTFVVADKVLNAHCYQWHQPCNPVREGIEINPEDRPIFWIDEYGILLETDPKTGTDETTRLTQYARRPEPPES